MTLDVPRDLQYALLEFIAHINVEDYDAIPQDFINLGFSPPDVTQERLQNSGITEGLSFAFRQLAAGGGPTKIQERVKEEFKERYGTGLTDDEIQVAARAEMMERMEAQLASEGVDVKGVTNIMEEVSRRNRELFSLPPYVLYLARAFSTLEGIGLSIDDNYSIIQECYPYLASRLFTDRNPRAKKALKAMLGLSNEEDVDEKLQEHQMVASSSNTNTNGSGSGLSVVQSAVASSHNDGKMNGFSPAKLLEMSEGFSSYTATTTNVDGDGRGQLKAATEFTKLFLDPKGSTLQDILVDETAKFGDALTRATLRAALIDNPAAKAAFSALRAPKGILQDNKQLESLLPGPLKSFLVDRPADLPDFMEALVATTQEDERILSSFQELRNTLVGPRRLTTSSNGASSDDSTPRSASQQASQAASTVSDLLSDEETRQALMEQLPGAVALGRRMGAGLLRRAAYRTERTPILSEGARQRGIDANMELANAIEPKQFHEEE
jgi:aarF domain-containing kinase